MSTHSSPATHDGDTFICECEGLALVACRGEGFYKEHDGRRYCVLHYPGTEKKVDFAAALQRKLDANDFNFQGVWFPDVINLSGRTINADANFSRSSFSADASFASVQFSAGVSFSGARFGAAASFYSSRFRAGANFSGARFIEAVSFSDAQFSAGANFIGAVFSATTYFHLTKFIEQDNSGGKGGINSDKGVIVNSVVESKARTVWVSFYGATFKNGIRFTETVFADQTIMSFAAANFEKPEHVVFHTTTLLPHWFLNVDSRKFTFVNVSWRFLNKRDAVRREFEAVEKSGNKRMKHLLEITYRQLAVNAEENNRYVEAGKFRYMAMDVRRLLGGRKVDLFRLSWWYWLLSGYGERVQRAFVALLTIWLLFAVVYWAGDATWQPRQPNKSAVAAQQSVVATPLTLPESMIYSVGVMSLQKPEPLPANKRARAFVLFETILGPLQAALLALAIRRKFMR